MHGDLEKNKIQDYSRIKDAAGQTEKRLFDKPFTKVPAVGKLQIYSFYCLQPAGLTCSPPEGNVSAIVRISFSVDRSIVCDEIPGKLITFPSASALLKTGR